jgi:Fic family protein
MRWNWQKPDWPHFQWDAARIAAAEEQFLRGAGTVVGVVKHLNENERGTLAVEAMSHEAVTTSKIEGEILDRASVQSSIQRQLGFVADKRRAAPAEEGVAEVMVDLYGTFSKSASAEMLFRWHRAVTLGRHDLADIGRFRRGKAPMQVISGRIGSPKIHFEAPPAKRVPGEMRRLLDWFNRTGPAGAEPLPAIARAGIAHLYFESIHPFEDGNGRIGRALAEKALAQSAGRPALSGLSAVILARRKSYYDALERANKKNEVTDWLAWFAETALLAQRRILAQIEFMIAKTRLLDRLRGNINDRQQKALLRMLREGPEGFKGGLSAGNYSTITGASPATTTRDLAGLVEQGALVRSGERKHARYALNLPHPE